MEELIVRVNNLLALMHPEKNGKDGHNKSISIGNYTFNPQKYELSFGENIRKLSHREAQILTMLIEKKNNAIDRREIMKVPSGETIRFSIQETWMFISPN